VTTTATAITPTTIDRRKKLPFDDADNAATGGSGCCAKRRIADGDSIRSPLQVRRLCRRRLLGR